jgi:hypothetical protein
MRLEENLAIHDAVLEVLLMDHDAPLRLWFLRGGRDLDPDLVTGHRAELRAALDRLEAYLDDPPKRPNLMDVTPRFWDALGGFDPDDLPRAQALYRRVVEAGGTGTTYAQEALLRLIAAAQDPASLSFWQEILDIRRPRDAFAKQRRAMALSALALLAMRQDDPVAHDALCQAARHDCPEVRALAIQALDQVYTEAERPIPSEVLNELTGIATGDPAFGPRFQARAVLRAAGQSMPPDNPGGVYAFKVKFKWARRIYRTIELRSEQTLDDLHHAIQRAIGWDADHLYSFFVGGVARDGRYRLSCPYEEDSPPWADEAAVGELGLTKGHKFLYYFDYGDCHEFEVEVVDIRPQAELGEYPHVADAKGDAPPQYGR